MTDGDAAALLGFLHRESTEDHDARCLAIVLEQERKMDEEMALERAKGEKEKRK